MQKFSKIVFFSSRLLFSTIKYLFIYLRIMLDKENFEYITFTTRVIPKVKRALDDQ